MTGEQMIRHCGLYARDLFDMSDGQVTGPHKIVGVTTTVRWDAEQDAAVFDLEGVALTVPSAALDAVGLVAVSAQNEGPAHEA